MGPLHSLEQKSLPFAKPTGDHRCQLLDTGAMPSTTLSILHNKDLSSRQPQEVLIEAVNLYGVSSRLGFSGMMRFPRTWDFQG